ncbi:hypothetical protein P4O66_014101, partial [Electrophorus voltai]
GMEGVMVNCSGLGDPGSSWCRGGSLCSTGSVGAPPHTVPRFLPYTAAICWPVRSPETLRPLGMWRPGPGHRRPRVTGPAAGQHMFGQYHPASQPDRRPSVARPAPMGGAQPPAQPGGLSAPRTAPQGPLGLPGLGQTRAKFLCPPREASRSMTSSAPQAQLTCWAVCVCVRMCGADKGPSALLKPQQCVNQRLLLVPLPQTPPLLQCPSECNEPPSSSVSATPPVRQHSQSAQSQCTPQSQPVPLCTAIIRPRMQVRRLPNCSSGSSDASVLAGTEPVANSACPTPTPTVQVRPMARAVATGMPTTAKQPSSARAAACARAVPEPVLVGRRQGQEVKEEPTSPPSPLSIIAKTGRGSERQVGEEGDDGASWYRLQLEEQRHQRQRHLRQKEQKHILLVRDRWRRQPRRDLPLGSAREQQPRWGKGPSPQSIPQLQPGPCKPTQLDRQVFLSLSEYRPYPDPKGHPHLQPSRLQRHRRRFAFRPTSRPLFQPVAPPGALAQPELSGLHSALAVGPLAVHSSQDGRVAIAVTVRRVLPGPWQGQRHAQEPAGASGHFQGRQGERRPLLMRVVRQLPPKKQELQHDGVETFLPPTNPWPPRGRGGRGGEARHDEDNTVLVLIEVAGWGTLGKNARSDGWIDGAARRKPAAGGTREASPGMPLCCQTPRALTMLSLSHSLSTIQDLSGGEDEERASVRLASLVIQGSRVVFEAKPRVVTFTPPALPTPSRTFTLGQGCPDPRR